MCPKEWKKDNATTNKTLIMKEKQWLTKKSREKKLIKKKKNKFNSLQ